METASNPVVPQQMFASLPLPEPLSYFCVRRNFAVSHGATCCLSSASLNAKQLTRLLSLVGGLRTVSCFFFYFAFHQMVP